MRLSWPLRSHSPPTCFRSWLGERALLSFTAVDTGQTPKCGSLHFPFPFSSLKSWVIIYQRTCAPCQCELQLPAKSPRSPELRSMSSLLLCLSPLPSPLSLTSWVRWPHPQHSDHSSFMSASCETPALPASRNQALVFCDYGGIQPWRRLPTPSSWSCLWISSFTSKGSTPWW